MFNKGNTVSESTEQAKSNCLDRKGSWVQVGREAGP